MTPIEWTAFITFISDLLWKIIAFIVGLYVGYTLAKREPPNGRS